MLEVEVDSLAISEVTADAVLTGTFEGSCGDLETICGNDQAFQKLVRPLVEDGEINGKLGSYSIIHSRGEIKPKRVMCIGLGKKEDLSLDRLRGMAAAAGRLLRDMNCHEIGTHLGFLPEKFRYYDTALAVIEGFMLGQYQFSHYLHVDERKKISKFGMYFHPNVEFDESKIGRAVESGSIIAQATNYTRDLCNEPGNVLTPTKLSEIALDLGKKYNVEVTVLDEDTMKEMGMNLLLAVGQGSTEPSKMIVLKYTGAGADQPYYGLLGKGVTFDSGGVSLKVHNALSHMHMDKTAGAVVLGVAAALSLLKSRVNFIGVVPAVENMLDGKAYKPGDIIRSLSGKTVEVTNTDAEGRLIMADTLTYMQNHLDLDNIIDFATLTGGAQAALGTDIIPIFSNDREMVAMMKKACWHSGEDCWEMPLYKNYRNHIVSQVADIKNHADNAPSMIIGALFLREFVDNKTKWMHVDIGGHEFREAAFSYLPYGATALGMRSLIRYFHRLGDHS